MFYKNLKRERDALRRRNEDVERQLEVLKAKAEYLDAECDSLNEQLLKSECAIVDPEWAARLGYQFLRLNSKPNSLASRVADEIQAKLRGKTEFVGIELANPIIVEINHSA